MTVQANPGISFQDAQRTYEAIKRERVQARIDLRLHLRDKAQRNHDLLKGISIKFAKYREAGKGVEESKILAKGDCAHLELARDLADAEAKAVAAHLDELEGSRATLRQMADWTREES